VNAALDQAGLVGRHVRSLTGETGEVVCWEPFGSALCDALLRYPAGREVWHASHDLRPADGFGPLPLRKDVRERARVEAIRSLRAIRAGLIAEWLKPWPGAEHGKALVGQMIDGALRDLGGRA
jgi:hypothetical protein